jgi:hypothetical protein
LFVIHSGNEGQDRKYFNAETAYKWLMKALTYGITHYEDANKYFREHFDVLAPKYVERKKLPL